MFTIILKCQNYNYLMVSPVCMSLTLNNYNESHDHWNEEDRYVRRQYLWDGFIYHVDKASYLTVLATQESSPHFLVILILYQKTPANTSNYRPLCEWSCIMHLSKPIIINTLVFISPMICHGLTILILYARRPGSWSVCSTETFINTLVFPHC